MPELGQVAIDVTGVIVRADRNFEVTMRMEPGALVGRNLLDFTAPADRERCIFVLAKLLEDGEPVSTVKRLIRDDGSHEWICNRLSMGVPVNDAPRIEISVESATAPSDWIDPAILLYVAKLLVEGRRARAKAFPITLFSDPAWDILLTAYVCEAEGGTLSVADLTDTMGTSSANTLRWIRALSAEGLVEYERGDGVEATTSFRLSCEAHQKFERFLSDRHRHAASFTRAFATQG
jgi:DNA-binding MarR family transcriptional regulator